MKKIILVACTIVFLSTWSSAQKSVVKLGIGSLLQGDVQLKYEYALDDKQSLQLGVLWDTPDKNFKIVEYLRSDADADANADFNLKGYAFLPEYRYYLGKKGVMNSFYVGAYGRFRSRTLSTTDDFGTDYTFDVKMKLKNFGLGIGCGAQWIIADHFSIDWYIAGIGYNQFFFKSTASVSDYESLEQLKMDAIEYIEDLEFDVDVDIQELKDVIIEEIEKTDSPSISTPTTPFGLVDFRVGVSLGYAF